MFLAWAYARFVDSRNWHRSRPKCHLYLVYHLLGITSRLSGYMHSPGPGTLVQGLVSDTGTGMGSPKWLKSDKPLLNDLELRLGSQDLSEMYQNEPNVDFLCLRTARAMDNVVIVVWIRLHLVCIYRYQTTVIIFFTCCAGEREWEQDARLGRPRARDPLLHTDTHTSTLRTHMHACMHEGGMEGRS